MRVHWRELRRHDRVTDPFYGELRVLSVEFWISGRGRVTFVLEPIGRVLDYFVAAEDTFVRIDT